MPAHGFDGLEPGPPEAGIGDPEGRAAGRQHRGEGKKEGWVFYAYQAFLKEPPDRAWRSSSLQSKPLTPEMRDWIKGYNIRRAKSHVQYGT
ncbi:hypothetical protein [Azotobacter beijerinckii]|uniref:hypothetical protein n=1 Tax=Azotobacter beijerinckii TaxID=170623 RepID=UPI00158820D7|nr:hypothetical protein [Azotobacter beijerinckii]